MTAQVISARAEVEMTIDAPVTIVRHHDECEITGRRVTWRVWYNGPDADPRSANFGHVSATLFNGSHGNAQIDGDGVSPGDDDWPTLNLPDWCPLPPEGWDAAVRAFREQCERQAASA